MKSFYALIISAIIYLIFYGILWRYLNMPRRNVEIDEMFYTYKVKKKNRRSLLANEEMREGAINSYESLNDS